MHSANHIVDSSKKPMVRKVCMTRCFAKLLGKILSVRDGLIAYESHKATVFVKCNLEIILCSPLVSPRSESESHRLFAVFTPPANKSKKLEVFFSWKTRYQIATTYSSTARKLSSVLIFALPSLIAFST
jgi:hypothetical protein